MGGVTAVVGDSPPLTVQQRTSSAESNFRELDDAFLQTQARIWLGEVLQIRFDEQMDISDLLADGELLFEVSEMISRMLPTLSVDEGQPKVHERKSLVSNKSTRRYMPYYNVDSFIRMCKSLGMDGIDLFTPSDVVERRNTRKVCMCLRSVSKKTRLRDLNVPDFDSVTCTVTMPTDMVGCIRKSLEMSQSSSSLSVEQEAEKVSRIRYWRRMSNSVSAVSNVYSDNCDEAESSPLVAESYGSSDYAYDAESPNLSGSQVVEEHKSVLHLSKRDLKNEDNDQCEYLSPSNAESVGSPCSQYYSDEELSMLSSNFLASRISGKVPKLHNETNLGHRNGDVSHIPIEWGNSHLDFGDYEDGKANVDRVNCVTHDKDDVDITCSNDIDQTGDDMCNIDLRSLNSLSKVDCDKCLRLSEPPECALVDDLHAVEAPKLAHEDAPSKNNISKPYSHGKENDKDLSGSYISKPLENPGILDNTENHASIECSEVIKVGGNYFCDRLNNGNASSEDVVGQSESHEDKVHICNSSSLLAVESNVYDKHHIPARHVAESEAFVPKFLERDTNASADVPCSQIKKEKEASDDNMITPDHAEQKSGNGFVRSNVSNSLDKPHTDLYPSPCAVGAGCGTRCLNDCYDDLERSEGHDALVESVKDKPTCMYSGTRVNGSSDPQPEAQSPKHVEDTVFDNHHQCMKEAEKGESGIVKQERTNKESPVHKPQRKLLKSVVKGTALLGIAVFLLHLRNNRWKSNFEAKKQPIHIFKQAGMPKPSQKVQKGGNASTVYPAEKLRLGI